MDGMLLKGMDRCSTDPSRGGKEAALDEKPDPTDIAYIHA
jgi:hypothetical protein